MTLKDSFKATPSFIRTTTPSFMALSVSLRSLLTSLVVFFSARLEALQARFLAHENIGVDTIIV